MRKKKNNWIQKNILINALLVLMAGKFSLSWADSLSTQANPDINENSSYLIPELWLGGMTSSVYGFIAHGLYTNFLTPKDAGAFLLDYGPNQFRIDLTWAHIFEDDQRIKLSAQHFSQNNQFDFVSGETGSFIGQNQLAAEYQHSFNQPWLQLLGVQAYYVKANQGDLSPVILSDEQGEFIDERTLVGGKGGGFALGPQWKLGQDSELSLAVNYDTVSFPAQNQPANDSKGFGGTARIKKLIRSNGWIELMATQRQPYTQYAAHLFWNAYHTPKHDIGLQLTLSHMNSSILPAENENVIGLNFVYRWNDGHHFAGKKPLCFNGDMGCDLLRWAGQSAAYLPGVYVQNDESVLR